MPRLRPPRTKVPFLFTEAELIKAIKASAVISDDTASELAKGIIKQLTNKAANHAD